MRIGRIAWLCLVSGVVACASGAEDSKPIALAQTPQVVQQAITTRIGDGALEEIDQTVGTTGATYDVDYLSKSGTEGGFTVTDTGAVDSVEITIEDAPAAVQKTVRSDCAGCELNSIDRNADGTFDIDILRAGVDQSFTVADDGTILSVSVAMADVPSTVQATIQSQAAGWQVSEIDKNMDEFPATYDVDLVKDGQEKSITIGSDGTLASADTSLAAVPAPVQAAINSLVGTGHVISIDQNYDPDGVSFDIEARSAIGANLSFSLGPDGAEQSERVNLKQVPLPARATITQTIGNGRILRVDHILVGKEDKVLPYSVEGRKDGKSFDFSVGPKGRFLGMDP